MSNPEIGGSNHEGDHEKERRLLAITEAQRDALLIAIHNEISACENEVMSIRKSGLTTPQAIEDYTAIGELITRLEEIKKQLTSIDT